MNLITPIFCLIAGFLCYIFFWRNMKVEKYRLIMISRIRELNTADTLSKKEHNWRIREFDQVSYHVMIWKFWRSLDSFYPKRPDRKVK